MKIILMLLFIFLMYDNKVPIGIYRDNENCRMLVRVDTFTLKLDTVSLELNKEK